MNSRTIERVAEARLATEFGQFCIINKIRAYALQDEGADTIQANERLGLAVDLRCYEQCAEILRDLGLNRVRLMSNNPEKMRVLEEMGLNVIKSTNGRTPAHRTLAHGNAARSHRGPQHGGERGVV